MIDLLIVSLCQIAITVQGRWFGLLEGGTIKNYGIKINFLVLDQPQMAIFLLVGSIIYLI